MPNEEILGQSRVRVTRTIIVEGPAEAVRQQLARSWLSLDRARFHNPAGVEQYERTREIHYLDAAAAQYDITLSRSDS
jgi:hypothetical protein